MEHRKGDGNGWGFDISILSYGPVWTCQNKLPDLCDCLFSQSGTFRIFALKSDSRDGTSSLSNQHEEPLKSVTAITAEIRYPSCGI